MDRYGKFLKKAPEGPLYRSLATLALAACHEQKGEFKAAIAVLEPLAGDAQDPLREVALLSLSRIYRLDNNPDRSKELLSQFVEEYQDSPFLPFAKANL
jgi:predicted negative regulator of RcsB-dependent stress response